MILEAPRTVIANLPQKTKHILDLAQKLKQATAGRRRNDIKDIKCALKHLSVDLSNKTTPNDGVHIDALFTVRYFAGGTLHAVGAPAVFNANGTCSYFVKGVWQQQG